MPFKLIHGQKPTFGLHLRVGFYFLLLLLLMYDKRAMINVLNNIMIVIASFISMASPPFEGKPRPPKIQLYVHYTCYFQCVQAFLHLSFIQSFVQ
jgi:hypothetical protein